MASSLKTRLYINFTICGVKLFLGSDVSGYTKRQHDAGSENDLSTKIYYGSTNGLNISFGDMIKYLLKQFKASAADLIPEELIPDLLLEDIYALYDGSTKEVYLLALSKFEKKEVCFFCNYKMGGANEDADNWAIGIHTDIGDLSGLPMVGEEMKDVKLANVGFIYTKNGGKFIIPALEPDPEAITTKSKPAALRIIPSEKTTAENAPTYTKGFNFLGEINLPIDSEPFQLSLPAATKDPSLPPPPAGNTTPAVLQSNTKWFKLNKKLGPVTVGQVGLRYRDKSLALLISGDVNIAALTISLNGLGVSFLVSDLFKKEFHPSFNLDGIGLMYSKPPVLVSGSFLHAIEKDKKGKDIDVYNGTAVIKASKFTITALGSYANYNGQTSLFIYGMYQGNIGGPSFFFVTGIAAGFGYNRSVRIPKITDVNTFPLVAMALSPDPSKTPNNILDELIKKDCIPISPGDYWLAIGIKFTSFKIIESFLLVIVQFGTRTEFTILGLSLLAWPNKENPIAYVELALKASFGPDTDVISVEAMITNNSYILDKNCKLTGGFAFYAWVSGEHEGDFVITLGGYHPRFIKPSHYPTVQRLGLNWQISNELQIKGGLYYALTPSCIMAGGSLEITYTLSFLKGSIIIWADMLIAWAPFHYMIDLGIIIRIEANIDFGLFSLSFSIEMGAQLHIWGPPFGGKAYVDWSIFSFTIPFGNSNTEENKFLEWPDFKKQFIPAKKDTQIYPAADIMITAGIIKEGEAKGIKYTIVNPHKLSVKVEAPVPITSAEIKGNHVKDAIGNNTNKPFVGKTELGIRPMGITQLSSTLTIKFGGVAGPGLNCSPYANSVPEALWSPEQNMGNNSSPGGSKVLPNAMKGMILSPKEVGIPEGTPQFDLRGKFEVIVETLKWQYFAARTGPDNNSYVVPPVKKIITGVFEDEKITGKRHGLVVDAFNAQGISDKSGVEDNIQDWVNGLTNNPVIVQLGGLPQYANEAGR